MFCDCHLRAHYFHISEVQIRTAYIKHNNPFIDGLYFRKVEYRTFVLIAGIANPLILPRPAFIHFKDTAPGSTPRRMVFHHLRLRYLVCPPTDINSISGNHFRLCFPQSGKRFLYCSTVGIATIRSHKIICCRKRKTHPYKRKKKVKAFHGIHINIYII